ncbi:hypothetical protein INT48_005830 [Thamnidium elegans]|uniref:Kelch repeat protein n=1 Tax=Thamnidium elegans TaxID=101142 RepID=A0A8H7SUJ9_9FUNG|nr:hypothetical protein INT48_005830 [Thamnidium elegans]
MYLDIVYSSGNSTTELATKWTSISSKINGVNIQSRDHPQSLVLPDGKTMIISGGWSTLGSPLLTAQTIAYNADSNSWSGYPSYTEPPFGVRQIYYASSVYVPEYGVGFYGGYESNINPNWTYKGQNMNQYNNSGGFQRYIGYTSLTFLDIKKNNDPWFVFPTQNNLPEVFPRSQTSIFDTLSKRIFFFGGKYRNLTSSVNSYKSFETSATFDVISGTWGSQVLVGIPPSERTHHTTTLITSTNRDVLLYGGENDSNDDKPSLDYLYTLNLDSYEWTRQYIQNEDELDLARTEHSVPSNISHLSAYVDPNGVARPSNSPGLSTGATAGVSVGATAGIAVGAVVGGLIIITALFCVWKRNNDKKKKGELNEIKSRNVRIEEPVMEVNWEAIDQNFTYSPPFFDDSATVVLNKPEFSANPMLALQGAEIQRPNAIDGDVKSLGTALQKPDGGS